MTNTTKVSGIMLGEENKMIFAYKESEKFLQKQMNGITGHIEVAGYPFDQVEWGQEDNIGLDSVYSWGAPWWAYEQTAYWVDGFTRCAILLRDKVALSRVEKMFRNVFQHADEDGYLGPKFLKEVKDDCTRWPHVVFFRALMAWYEYNRDQTILEGLTKHYLGNQVDYSAGRNILNVEIMLWLYQQTGNEELLHFAEENYVRYNENNPESYFSDAFALSSALPTAKDGQDGAHGVSYNEYSKLGAILFQYTGKEQYLKASIAAYKKVDKHYMLIDGLHNCAEKLISNSVNAQHETCNITDFSWSQNYMFEASGNTEYLDKIEKCVWNAGLGAVTEDFKALQYFSGVNLVVLDDESATGESAKGAAYKPAPYVQCCIGNVNRFMPNYIWNSWKKDGDDVYLKLFCSSVFRQDGIEIKEQTNYPYENTVKLKIRTGKGFRLHLRLPKWNEGYTLFVNGKEVQGRKQNGFVVLSVEKDCSVEYRLKCSLKKRTKNNYVWFEKGALVYTHKVDSLWKIDKSEKRSSEEFPAYFIYPIAKWNYGIADGGAFLEQGKKVLVQAYEVDNWKLIAEGQVAKMPVPPRTPQVRRQDCEWIELTPYGLSECRVTAFARIKNGIGEV